MLADSSAEPSGPARGQPFGVPVPWYRAAVVALAVLLTGLSVLHRPPTGFVASVKLQRRVARGPDPLRGATAEAQVSTGHEVTADRLRQLLASDLAATRLGNEPGERTEAAARLAARLRVRLEQPDQGWNSPLRIDCRGQDRREALDLAEAAAASLMAAVDREESRRVALQAERLSRWELRELRHYEQRARLALNEFLAGWQQMAAASITDLAESREQPEPSAAERARASAFAPARSLVVNPRWEQLNQQLGQLDAQRQQLLASLQPGHPQVQQMTLRMVELQAELSRTEEHLEVETAAPVSLLSAVAVDDPRDSAEPDSSAASGQQENAAQPSWQTTWSELTDNYQQAVARREQAERQNEADLHQLLATARAVRSWHVSTPAIAGRLGTAMPRNRLAGLLLLALVAGGLIVWLERRSAGASVPAGSDQEAGSQRPDGVPGGGPGGGMRTVTRIAEGVVVVQLVACLLLLAAGNPLLADLRADPFGAWGEILPRLIECWLA